MSKKILVIDDDKLNVKLVQSWLKEKGFEIIAAHDGEEGLRLVAQEKPNLILLDVEMPKMNGYTFMTELNKSATFKSIPVVVLTSHEENQPIFQLKGVKAYLIKPIDFNLLVDKINNYII